MDFMRIILLFDSILDGVVIMGFNLLFGSVLWFYFSVDIGIEFCVLFVKLILVVFVFRDSIIVFI